MENYCKLVADKIGYHLDCIGKTAKLNDTVLLIQELMPDAYLWLDEDINVNWPVKEIGEVKIVLNMFARKGILLNRFIKSETSPRWTLKNGEIRIDLSPSWSKEEGASCRLVQVGVTKSEYPVYKLVCTDKEFDELQKTEEAVA